MYREHFGLTTAPFGISPRLDFLFRSAAFEESMAHLLYGLENSEAVVLITGAIGTGKTMAVQSFLAHLGDRFLTALVTNTRVDGKELLKLVLEDLGRTPAAGADKSDLLIAFKQLLIESGRDGRRVVIIVDEAQNLDRDVLEEIRLLTNLGQGDEQPVQVVLVGQPELELHVEQPELAQLRQRIRVHCRLAPLSRAELTGYVERRMEVAGGQPGLFATAALDRVYVLSGGVPRVINTLCSEAMLSAFVAGRRRIEAQDVGERMTVSAADPDATQAEASRLTPATPQPPVAGAPAAGPIRSPKSGMAVRRDEGPRSRQFGARGWWGLGAVMALVATLALTGLWRPIRDLVADRAAAPDVVSSRAPTDADLDARPVGEVTSAPVQASSQHGSAAAPPGALDPASSLEHVAVDSVRPALGAAVDDVIASDHPSPTLDVLPVAVGGGAAGSVGDAVPSETPDIAEGEVPPSTNDWYIHVSSFRTAPHAASVAEGFARNGVGAIVREQIVRDVTWHRVYLGPYTTHDAAVRRANAMREAGKITYYKVQRMTPTGGL